MCSYDRSRDRIVVQYCSHVHSTPTRLSTHPCTHQVVEGVPSYSHPLRVCHLDCGSAVHSPVPTRRTLILILVCKRVSNRARARVCVCVCVSVCVCVCVWQAVLVFVCSCPQPAVFSSTHQESCAALLDFKASDGYTHHRLLIGRSGDADERSQVGHHEIGIDQLVR